MQPCSEWYTGQGYVTAHALEKLVAGEHWMVLCLSTSRAVLQAGNQQYGNRGHQQILMPGHAQTCLLDMRSGLGVW